MLLKEIQTQWAIDSKWDIERLEVESAKTGQLHSKYHNILSFERIHLKTLESDLTRLRFEKYKFYTEGPTQADLDKGWEPPSIGKIDRVLRNQADRYLDSDKDILAQDKKIEVQREKIRFLESIIAMINNRSFQINGAVKFLEWKAGR